MYTLPNVTFLGVEANTPSDGIITISILGRGVGEVCLSYNALASLIVEAVTELYCPHTKSRPLAMSYVGHVAEASWRGDI